MRILSLLLVAFAMTRSPSGLWLPEQGIVPARAFHGAMLAAAAPQMTRVLGSFAAPPAATNEPAGYTPIVIRHFNTKAASDADRGTGTAPNKVGGAEGWDGTEANALWTANLSIVDVTGEPLGSGGKAMRTTYPNGHAASNAPATYQTQSLGSYPNLYCLNTIRLGPDYTTNGVQNKLYFHRTADPHRGEPFLSLLSNGDGTFKLHVNFQGTPINGAGFFAATGGGAAIEKDVWYTIETLLLMSSAPGAEDGTFRCWVDDELVIDKTDVQYYDGVNGNTTWAALHVSPTWGGSGSVVTPFYWDHGYSYVSGAAA